MTRFLHSSSFQKQLDVCPQAGWLYQSGAEKGPTPDHFLFGQAAHLVMQMYVDWCVSQRRRTDISVIGDFIDAATKKLRLPIAKRDELDVVIRGYLNVYEIDVEHSLEREGGIAFDEELNARPWSDEYDYETMKNPAAIAARGIMFRARLDETKLFPGESRLEIVDFKSDRFAPSQSSIEDPSSRFYQQGKKYAWAGFRAIYPADIVEVTFSFMRFVKYGKALTRRLIFTREDMAAIEEQEIAKIRLIEGMTDFPARPGDQCKSCVFRETACPVPTEILTDDPAAIARKYLYGEVQQEIFRDRIKENVAQYGWEGEMGALRSEFTQGTKEVPDMKEVWRELQDVGVEEPWRFMSFSNSDAKNLLDKDVYERIKAAAYRPEVTARFNVHQPKPVLLELARAHGIDTQVRGKSGMKDKTVAQLAWDLANLTTQDGGHQPERPALQDDAVPAAPMAPPPPSLQTNTNSLDDGLQELL
jgi:hypothetical protein